MKPKEAYEFVHGIVSQLLVAKAVDLVPNKLVNTNGLDVAIGIGQYVIARDRDEKLEDFHVYKLDGTTEHGQSWADLIEIDEEEIPSAFDYLWNQRGYPNPASIETCVKMVILMHIDNEVDNAIESFHGI